jgi:integrase/recombinase XerD
MRKRKNSPGNIPSRGSQLPSNALTRVLRDFIDQANSQGLSPLTTRHRQRAVARFIRWADERGLGDPREITLPILERYQRHLYHYRKPNGEPLSFSSQYTELAPLKAFFAWLTRQHIILYNPASELQLPKVIRNIARYVLSVEDVELILKLPDTRTLLGFRDRTILEVLYSTGIRRAEMMRLLIYDIDIKNLTVLVREGKGQKDRLVPIGERACYWVTRYLQEVRPQLIAGHDDGKLFLTRHGDAMTDDHVTGAVKEYVERSGVAAEGACHLFRHAMATHMLENGADTRYIQAMLGHSDLSTTQIYTHVALTKLKEIHAATHPAKLESTGESEALIDALSDEIDDENARLYRVAYHPRPNRRGPRKKKDTAEHDELA